MTMQDLGSDGQPEAQPELTSQDGGAAPGAEPDAPPPIVETIKLEPPGRRGRAAGKVSDLESGFKSLGEQFGKYREEHQAELSRRDAQLAEIKGMLQGYASTVQRQNGGSPPTADDLEKQATAALDQGSFSEYQRLTREATMARVAPLIEQAVQQRGPQGADARIVMVQMMAQQDFPDVMAQGEKGVRMAHVKDQELALMGVPDGPARYRQAFEMARAALGTGRQAPQYSQASRGVLASMPTPRGGGRNGDAGAPNVRLDENASKALRYWREQKLGTDDEFARYYADAVPGAVDR